MPGLILFLIELLDRFDGCLPRPTGNYDRPWSAFRSSSSVHPVRSICSIHPIRSIYSVRSIRAVRMRFFFRTWAWRRSSNEPSNDAVANTSVRAGYEDNFRHDATFSRPRVYVSRMECLPGSTSSLALLSFYWVPWVTDNSSHSARDNSRIFPLRSIYALALH